MKTNLKFRLALIIGLMGVAAVASANAAMGYALEVFEFKVWTIYVAATIVLEAWVIGRGLGHGWLKSIGLSLLVNSITAFCCAGGMFAPFLHPDSRHEMNPLQYSVELLVVFGLFSAFIEAIPWSMSVEEEDTTRWLVLKKSFVAHAIGIPLALMILLIPAHPYPGLDFGPRAPRRSLDIVTIARAYKGRIDPSGKVTQFRNRQELEKRLDEIGGYSVSLYHGIYERFGNWNAHYRVYEVELNPNPTSEAWVIKIHREDDILEFTLPEIIDWQQGVSDERSSKFMP